MRRVVVLDSGAVTAFARRDTRAAAAYRLLLRHGPWPPLVPAAVLVECLTGDPQRDANTNRLLKTCQITTELPTPMARRSARLRSLAHRGSAVDAIVVAAAEPGGAVITSDIKDIGALADHAADVEVRRV